MESDSLSNNTLSVCARDGQQQGRPSHGRTSGPTRRSTKGQWSAEEDEILRTAVQRFKGKNWKKIAECFKDRTDVQCLHRWQKVLNPDLVKGPWSKEEDEIIIEMVKKYGPTKWSMIAQHLPGRIGKQCRERWHNHLNPNINKQAWTQEEELSLIRAHQVYGNKWAELTKYLPGRTDNAIKNHWNSSVKKKLDMYVTSGLLSQFQGPPLVNHSAASSSSKALQSSEDDSINKGKREMDEPSECSQPSTNNRITHPIVDRRTTEELSQFPYSEDYQPELQQDTFSMSEKFLEHDLSLDWGAFAGKHWQIDSNELPDMSLLDLGQVSSDLFMPSANHESGPVPPDSSTALVASNSMIDMVMGTDAPNFIDLGHDGCFNSQNENEDSLFYTNANYQMPENGNFVSQSFYMPETSFNRPFSISTQLPPDDFLFSENPNQNNYTSLENAHEVLISDSIPCEDNSNESKGSPRIVPANDFVMAPSTYSQCVSFKGKGVTESDEEKESGVLFYEPPHFPSLEVPFFSCDLIQSGSDVNQDYSPLGIRQLMISSSSMMTPLKLWDSPSRDDSPESVLRSAAKTFTGTPSILKKRNRDLVSPLSEKRGEKKQELSNLRNDSRLESMFDECVEKKEAKPLSAQNTEGNIEEHCTDKENVDPGQANESIVISERRMSKKDFDGSDCLNQINEQISEEDVKNEGGIDEMETAKECSGILVERDTNDVLFLSPDHFGIKSRAISLSARALGNRKTRRLDTITKNGAILSSVETSCFSVLCSPRLSTKKDGDNLVITTASLKSLSPTEKKILTSCSSVAFESNRIFVETSFKRNMESPSAWKSPWLFNTFVPGPRVDTDITIEDIGYLLSPAGDRSYDAIGFMKQLGEQNASAFADAQEVLGDETPETIMKEKSFINKEPEKENGHAPNSNTDHLQALSPSKLMTERRTLDFSECGTPVKHTEKFSSSTSHSSPSSSHLLKSCR